MTFHLRAERMNTNMIHCQQTSSPRLEVTSSCIHTSTPRTQTKILSVSHGFPKRMSERLQIRSENASEVGWGVHFAEGLHWKKVLAVEAIVTLTSIIFGVCWSVLRNDIQGGFGVSAYVMAILAFGIGTMQAFQS